MRREGWSVSRDSGVRLALLLGVVCILVGYWAPWVAHPAAGLVQNGFDLSEFVKFLPQVKTGGEFLYRWLFFLPLPSVALSLSMWAASEGRGLQPRSAARWVRSVTLGVSLLLLIILIPPYPYTLERVLGSEFRERTILTLVSWAALVLVLIGAHRWLGRRWRCVLLAFLAVIGTIAPLVQFLSLHDALSAVYGRSIVIGWGVWVMATGMLLVLVGAAWGLGQSEGTSLHGPATDQPTESN